MLSGFYCSFPYASDAPFSFIIPPVPGGTRPDCGGILSSATTSQMYASGHLQCGVIPPTPPVPPPTPTGGGGIGGGGALLRGRPIRPRPLTPYERQEMVRQYDDGRRRDKQFEDLLAKLNDSDGEDQEDLMIMISTWMSLKD